MTIAIAFALVLLGAPARAEARECVPNKAPSGLASFKYTGAEQTWVVPPGIRWIRVTLVGGDGGTEENSALGGAGGGVRATVSVNPGDCMAVYVGGYGAGHGGWGWGHGGDHGHAPGDGGYSGGGGGGASALVGSGTIVLGGGGGGGGGEGYSSHSDENTPGGLGGIAGPPPVSWGGDAPHSDGGKGGCGACAQGVDGAHGQNAGLGTFHGQHGAGGGGGSGWNGGGGGDHGHGTAGGGGGGAGESYTGRGTGAVVFFNREELVGNGTVTIAWPTTPPANAARIASQQRELLVTRTGTVRLALTCTRRSGRCEGIAHVRARRRSLARARYSVRAGRRAMINARLTAAGRAALRRDMTVTGRLRTGTGVTTPGDGHITLISRRAPATTVRSTRLKATPRGRVRARLACPKTAATGCTGRLRLHDTRAKRSTSTPFRLRAGRTAIVSVRLTRQARRALARNRRLDLLATTTTRLRVGTPTRRVHDVQVTRAH